jgi:hypothetical protein
MASRCNKDDTTHPPPFQPTIFRTPSLRRKSVRKVSPMGGRTSGEPIPPTCRIAENFGSAETSPSQKVFSRTYSAHGVCLESRGIGFGRCGTLVVANSQSNKKKRADAPSISRDDGDATMAMPVATNRGYSRRDFPIPLVKGEGARQEPCLPTFTQP